MSGVQIRCQHRSGFELLVTCDSLDQLDITLARLVEAGCRPLHTNGETAGESPAAPSSKAPSCPKGHGLMRPSKKYAGWYCPQQLEEDGQFCSEKVVVKK
jgi:hypothetical protein